MATTKKTSKILSAYQIFWLILVPARGIVSKKDSQTASQIVGFNFSNVKKSMLAHKADKTAAKKAIKMLSGKLSKSYTAYIITDKQFGLASKENTDIIVTPLGHGVKLTELQKKQAVKIKGIALKKATKKTTTRKKAVKGVGSTKTKRKTATKKGVSGVKKTVRKKSVKGVGSIKKPTAKQQLAAINNIYADMSEADVLYQLEYLTSKQRKKRTTEANIRKQYKAGKIGNLLKRLDPIAYYNIDAFGLGSTKTKRKKATKKGVSGVKRTRKKAVKGVGSTKKTTRKKAVKKTVGSKRHKVSKPVGGVKNSKLKVSEKLILDIKTSKIYTLGNTPTNNQKNLRLPDGYKSRIVYDEKIYLSSLPKSKLKSIIELKREVLNKVKSDGRRFSVQEDLTPLEFKFIVYCDKFHISREAKIM